MFLTDYVVKHTDYVICIVFFILISIIKLGKRKEMLHMILFLSRSVVRSLIKNDAIEMEKAEVYQYGFEILFSSIITFLIAVLSGILLHCFAASMLFFIIFATFRQICGGYHAKHYWSCNLLFLGVISAVLVVYRFFPTDRFTTMHYIFLLVSLLIICIYAPVENENKPLSAEQVLLFRKISRIIVISLTMISCLINIFHNPYIKLIDSTLLAISISILVVGLEERGFLYEKKSSESAHCCNDERHLLFCRCRANLCSGVSFFYIAVKSAYQKRRVYGR